MNEAMQNLLTRRSCRAYKPDLIPDAVLSDILEAIEEIQPDILIAIVCIVLADKNIGTYLYDGSLVMGNLMNAAHANGIASCWIHRAKEVFASEEGKQILADLGITGDYEGIGNCILGYAAAPEADPKPRKENYVYYIK